MIGYIASAVGSLWDYFGYNTPVRETPVGSSQERDLKSAPDVKAGSYQRRRMLHKAVQNGDIPAIQELINTGEDLRARCGAWPTAFAAACNTGHVDLLEFFLHQGARVEEFPLQVAIRYGQKNVTRFLLDHGADPNVVPDQPDHTPLITAVSLAFYEPEIVECLLDHGADVNACTSPLGPGTAVLVALRDGNIDAAKLLMARGASLTVRGGTCHSALHVACFTNRAHIVSASLKDGFDVHERGGEFDTPLQAACAAGAEECVKLLLEAGANTDVNLKGGKYFTALHAAAASGSAECVTLLLDNGADIHAEGGEFGSVLKAALSNGSSRVVEVLLDRGATLDPESPHSKGLLSSICRSGSVDLVRRLLDTGMDVNEQNDDELYRVSPTPLWASLQRKDDEVVELLLSRGADPNLYVRTLNPPLIGAIERGKVAAVKLLLDHGANPNIVNPASQEEYTPLICAVSHGGPSKTRYGRENGSVEIINLLLDRGADLTKLSTHGASVLKEALQNEDEEIGKSIISLLLARGADVNACDAGGTSLLAMAAGNGQLAYVEHLIDCGARVNPEDAKSLPLTQAALSGHVDVVKALLARGADVNAKVRRGTAVQAAFWAQKDLQEKKGIDDPEVFEAKSARWREIESILRENGATGPSDGGKFGMFDIFVDDVAQIIADSLLAGAGIRQDAESQSQPKE